MSAPAKSTVFFLQRISKLPMELNQDNKKKKKNSKAVWIPVIAAAIGAFITGIFVLLENSQNRPPVEMEGRITTPKDNEAVNNIFIVKGQLKNISPDKHIWLAIKRGSNIWPKIEINRNDIAWIEKVEEYGSSHEFGLILMVVDGPSHQQIIDWKLLKDKQNVFTPIDNLNNRTILDAVQLKLKSAY